MTLCRYVKHGRRQQMNVIKYIEMSCYQVNTLLNVKMEAMDKLEVDSKHIQHPK